VSLLRNSAVLFGNHDEHDKEGPTRKLTMTLAAAALMLSAMAIAADAQSAASGAAGLHAQIQNATPIDKAACRGSGAFCPPGTVRRCGAYRCWCARCY